MTHTGRMSTLPPGREIVGPERAPMEMALYGDAYVHLSALPDLPPPELKGMSPIDAALQQLDRKRPPTIPACLAGRAGSEAATTPPPNGQRAQFELPSWLQVQGNPQPHPRPVVNKSEAAYLRAVGLPDELFDVSPDVPR